MKKPKDKRTFVSVQRMSKYLSGHRLKEHGIIRFDG